jgi:hypothetical protein
MIQRHVRVSSGPFELVEPQDIFDDAARQLLKFADELQDDKAKEHIKKAVKALKKSYEKVR